MKKLVSFIILAAFVAFALPAFAVDTAEKAFALFSSASGTVRTTSVFSVLKYRNKTVIVNGATLASNASSTTFKNMSGTLVAECGPTSSGPWTTCKQAQSSGGADVSITSNGHITWRDVVSYIRLKWTGGTVGTKLKAWLNLSE